MTPLRKDLALISQWIRPDSRVLDLGCGDGALLAHLRHERGVTGYGLEFGIDNVIRCIEKGIAVIQMDLDSGLADFANKSFDYVIMTHTLQAMQFPARLLGEMLRVGREGIVTFPNFGHWRCRGQLAFGGKMPVSKTLPHQWYDTENIHLCTLTDFADLCRVKNIRIIQRMVTNQDYRVTLGARFLPNLLGEFALYRIQQGYLSDAKQ